MVLLQGRAHLGSTGGSPKCLRMSPCSAHSTAQHACTTNRAWAQFWIGMEALQSSDLYAGTARGLQLRLHRDGTTEAYSPVFTK